MDELTENPPDDTTAIDAVVPDRVDAISTNEPERPVFVTKHGRVVSRNLIFGICAMAMAMNGIDATIVATAIPRIGHALHSPLNWTGWTITLYQLGAVIAAPVAGRVSDIYGRKTIFVVCITVFTVASFACGCATSIWMLLPIRFIQALGGGATAATTSGIVADFFGRDRDRGIAMFASITPIGNIVGPIMGGVITQYWSWRGVFWFNLPLGIAIVVATVKFIPFRAPTSRTQFDVRGVLLLVPLIVSGMLAITTLGSKGSSTQVVLFTALVLSTFAFGYAFMRHARVTENAFIPLMLIRGKGFANANLLNFLFGTCQVGFAAMVPLYAENRYHFTTASSGTVLSARGVGIILVSTISAMLLRRTGYRVPMIIGFLTMAFSMTMLAVAPRFGLSPYAWLAIFSMFTGIGIGIASPATNNASLHLAPDHVAAMVGLRQMFRQTGGIFYVSIATAILARASNPGLTQPHIFEAQACVLVLLTGVVFTIHEHKGRW